MKPTATVVCIVLVLLTACKREAETASSEGGANSNTRTASQGRAASPKPSSPTTRSGNGRPQGRPSETKLAGLSDSELAALLDSVGSARKDPRNRETFELAVRELAHRDPEAALALFVPKEMSREEPGFRHLADMLAAEYPDLLVRWMEDHSGELDKSAQVFCVDAALMSLSVNSRPETAIALYDKMEIPPQVKSEYIMSIFSYYGSHDGPAAEKAARERFQGRDLNFALATIASSLGRKDPAAGFDMALRVPSPALKAGSLESSLRDWMNVDQTAAIAKLGTLEPNDLQAVLETTRENPDSLISQIAKANPQALGDLVGKMVATSANLPVFEAAVTALSNKHPDQAAALVDSIPEGPVKSQLVTRQISSLARTDTLSAIDQAAALQNKDARNQAYGNIAKITGETSLEATVQAADRLPEADQASFVATAFPEIASRDPKKAAEFLLDSPYMAKLDARALGNACVTVGQRLVTKGDSAFAAEWLERLPEDRQADAMRGIAGEMVRSDIMGLSNMLSALPAGKARETGAKVLIQELRKSDPQMAEQWEASLKQTSQQ